MLGTVAYMAPEQARGMPVDHGRTSSRSACVLYEMLAGERPFRGETATDTIAAILKEEPPPLPATVPPQLAGDHQALSGEGTRAPLPAWQRNGGGAGGGAVRGSPFAFHFAETVISPPSVVGGGKRGGGAGRAGAGIERGGPAGPGTQGGAAGRIDSLAVLPLENLSGDAAQDYLAAGLHEALITDLAQLGGLKRVIARGSVMRFAKTDKPPREIAKELGVNALITGSVLRSGDRVRVTAQLVDADTEAQVWAERYERDMRDVLALENDIVAAITRQIRLQLTAQEHARLSSARPVDPVAYEACLQGRCLRNKLSRRRPQQ